MHQENYWQKDFVRDLLVYSSGDGTLVVQNYNNPMMTIPNSTQLISTPEKLTKRIELAKANNQSARLVVLVLTGAFSPIHLDHVRVLQHAKKFMESKGFIVVAGILSPAYVLFSNLVTFQERLLWKNWTDLSQASTEDGRIGCWKYWLDSRQ